MKNRLSITSRIAVYLIGISLLVILIILLPELAREESATRVYSDEIILPFLIGAWVLSLPIFVSLQQTLFIIKQVEFGNTFSQPIINALKNIKICAMLFNFFIVMCLILIVITFRGTGEDITPFFTLSFVVVFVSTLIAIFIDVLQKLLQSAFEMKTESELTV